MALHHPSVDLLVDYLCLLEILDIDACGKRWSFLVVFRKDSRYDAGGADLLYHAGPAIRRPQPYLRQHVVAASAKAHDAVNLS